MDDLLKLDLYELLNISVSAEEPEIKKAYRKKALTCHPDKNPDNPKAAELFQQLSRALEVLTDKAARAAYDKVLIARKAAKVRHRELDSKRKKLKDDLEAREKSAFNEVFKEKQSADNLQKEIERLRREGSKQLEEEKERLLQEIQNEKLGLNVSNEGTDHIRLKVKWKSHKTDLTNGGYDKEKLETIFKKYGPAICLVSMKKRGSALVEFQTLETAQTAAEHVTGDSENPLTIRFLDANHAKKPQAAMPERPTPQSLEDGVLTNRDYESLTLMRLRQAEERKRLLQQMQEEDGD